MIVVDRGIARVSGLTRFQSAGPVAANSGRLRLRRGSGKPRSARTTSLAPAPPHSAQDGRALGVERNFSASENSLARPSSSQGRRFHFGDATIPRTSSEIIWIADSRAAIYTRLLFAGCRHLLAYHLQRNLQQISRSFQH